MSSITELKIENEKLKKQTQDLWELLSIVEREHQIKLLIALRGEEYVKKVFDEDYEDYKLEYEDEED